MCEGKVENILNFSWCESSPSPLKNTTVAFREGVRVDWLKSKEKSSESDFLLPSEECVSLYNAYWSVVNKFINLHYWNVKIRPTINTNDDQRSREISCMYWCKRVRNLADREEYRTLKWMKITKKWLYKSERAHQQLSAATEQKSKIKWEIPKFECCYSPQIIVGNIFLWMWCDQQRTWIQIEEVIPVAKVIPTDDESVVLVSVAVDWFLVSVFG